LLKKHFEKADKDKDGEISMEDWISALKKAKFEFSRKDVEDIFKEKDKDLNGKLSWEEFCGEKTPTEKAFCIMDVDNSGKVSKEEFRTFCKALSTKQVEAAFKKFDISGDDELDYEEFCKLMNSRDKEKSKRRDEEREKKKEEERKKRENTENQKIKKHKKKTKEELYEIQQEFYSV